MKTIIEGGLSSKNSPMYTIDSFLLANMNTNIDGIHVDIYLTKDNEIVLINQQILKSLGINEQYINDNTLSKIKKLNIGTRVKQNQVVSIEALLKIFTNKYVIVTLKENQDTSKNYLLVTVLLEYVNKYPNIKWYLTTSSTNILNLILSHNTEAKIGKIVNSEQDSDYSLDFFSTDINNINSLKNKTDSTTILCNIDTKEKYNFLNKYNASFKELFVIINNYNLIIDNHLQ